MRRLRAIGLLLVVAGCAAQPPAPNAQRYVVFFQKWSAALDETGTGAVGSAAKEALAHPDQRVIVIGFADPDGSKEANIYMSKTRAQMVSDQLVTDGVPAARISQDANGATPFTLNSLESRRVEIVVTP